MTEAAERQQPKPDERLSSPKAGDVLLGCKHEPSPYGAHIFHLSAAIVFMRPDGSIGHATWIVLCDGCYWEYVVQRGGSASTAPLACDHTWREGDEPLRFKEPS